METYHIHINGIVQGVGFRPHIYKLAVSHKLNGYVSNGSDGVHVFFNSSGGQSEAFFSEILTLAPSKARIIAAKMQKSPPQDFSGFDILVKEQDRRENKAFVTPDWGLCDSCREELHHPEDRRYRYPFITCTKCGPRYSILNELPFERHHSSMQQYSMCRDCLDEYVSANNSRFFSQTNSCPQCGIKISIYQNGLELIHKNNQEGLSLIKEFLIQGKILAVKGLGGFILLCNSNNPDIIELLRKRKLRPNKPLAVLYPTIEMVEDNFELNTQERAYLTGSASPIVLLRPRQRALNNLATRNIAPGLIRLGVMIPNTPLFDLIAKDYGQPLIATSGNISGSPIIYRDEEAFEYFTDIADYVVSYDRDIVVPEDDSVMQVSKLTHRPIYLRRSRGFAPSFFSYKPKVSAVILSMGAYLKSSFTLSAHGNVFISQFLGGGESYESQKMFKETLQHALSLYKVKPNQIVADLHPGYFTHQYALDLTRDLEADIIFVQHHQAHFAAVLAENKLLYSNEPVLGVIWDGTGLGTDGNIWGGEFFTYDRLGMMRCAHFDYYPSIAADKLAKEPQLAALCTTRGTATGAKLAERKFSSGSLKNYDSLIKKSTISSSSVGRIFDAVASLLDICTIQTYEGEAAMYLQTLAERYIDRNGFKMEATYFEEGLHHGRISTASLMEGIGVDIEGGLEKDYIAAKFHYSLVCLVGIIARSLQISKVCFSGGVFQNSLLVDWIQIKYQGLLELYFNQDLSPNDENISFGQLVYADNHIRTLVRTEWAGQLGIVNN